MEIKIISDLKSQECDILFVNKFENKETSIALANKYAVEEDHFEGKFLETYLLPTYEKLPQRKILVLGLGKQEDLNCNKVREGLAKAVKKAIQMKASSISLDFDGIDFDYTEAAIEGILIGEYTFNKYKTDDTSTKIEKLYTNLDKHKVEKAEKRIEAMSFARDLVNEPPELITPSKLAEVAKSLGLDTKIYDKKETEKMGMGAFLGVAKGSEQEPKFIHMKYSIKNPTKKVALIGKGITFDSGGMDLKPPASMLTMKDDMSGAACILAVMSKLKEFAPNIEVHGIIAACENMINGNAYKPGDVLKAKNGKTIEVDNTDAEGRLTLADALCFACELNVDEVIDIATLTGACMVALGTQASGIMGNNQELITSIIETGEKSGERFWQLPMFDGYKDSLKSDMADMKNTGSRYGGASIAGIFLKNFVYDRKWVHLDIAGTAYLDSPQNEFIKGATGVGVRTLLNYLTK